jgi:acetyl-CoA C-acetyltransferase
MYQYGTTREQLARVPVQAHEMGSKNPNAHYRNKITLEQVLGAGPVAEPLGVFDCAPLSDGAAAVVLGPLETARKYTDQPVRIAGCHVACDTLAVQHRKDVTVLESTVVAARRAFDQARRAPKDVNVAEVHDAYSISALVSLEDLGFSEKGHAGAEFAAGRFAQGGELPVNMSGGLKAQGRPFGAVGVAQVVELVRQLRGQSKERQVPNASVGLAQDVGGTGATSVVTLLEAV